MTSPHENPRVLVVTPEVTFLPNDMGPSSRTISARAGGLGDICAALIHSLDQCRVNVHLAVPNYRNVFKTNTFRLPDMNIQSCQRELPSNRIHLAQDRSFYYHSRLFLNPDWENIRIALAFQREVINRIIPEVQPDIVHCFDWMTGLIPAMARQMGIASLFSLYRLESPHLFLSTIEERGIDAAPFWQNCFYARMPVNYHETRETNPLDMLTTGVYAANHVQMLSETFLREVVAQESRLAPGPLKSELGKKLKADNLSAVPPAPDPSFNPATDRCLLRPYTPESHYVAKLFNKLLLQEKLNLRMDSTAPIFFWPTRLDGSRSGCRLMAEALPKLLERHRQSNFQIVFVADGDFQDRLRDLVHRLGTKDRVVISSFNASIYRLAYGASDFVLMPLRHDPCALPCKVGQRYGTLPVAFDAGAIHDCVRDLAVDADRGTGFMFKNFDVNGLLWAVEQAMNFFNLPLQIRSSRICRIMGDSLGRFDRRQDIRRTIQLYERALNRPLDHLKPEADESADPRRAA